MICKVLHDGQISSHFPCEADETSHAIDFAAEFPGRVTDLWQAEMFFWFVLNRFSHIGRVSATPFCHLLSGRNDCQLFNFPVCQTPQSCYGLLKSTGAENSTAMRRVAAYNRSDDHGWRRILQFLRWEFQAFAGSRRCVSRRSLTRYQKRSR